MSEVSEHQIVALLRLLRPAPAASVDAACAIPRLGRDAAAALAASSRAPEAASKPRGTGHDG